MTASGGTLIVQKRRSHLALFFCLLLASVADVTSFTPNRRSVSIQLHSSVAGAEPFRSNQATQSRRASSKRRRKKPRLPEKNLYDILGANQTMSRQEIKRQYITLAKEYHPDSAGPEYAGRFDEIARAWDVLSDNAARRTYDRDLAAEKFIDDIVQRASEVAEEYGPAAHAFYEDCALPFLRRAATTTIAGWSVIAREGERLMSEMARHLA